MNSFLVIYVSWLIVFWKLCLPSWPVLHSLLHGIFYIFTYFIVAVFKFFSKKSYKGTPEDNKMLKEILGFLAIFPILSIVLLSFVARLKPFLCYGSYVYYDFMFWYWILPSVLVSNITDEERNPALLIGLQIISFAVCNMLYYLNISDPALALLSVAFYIGAYLLMHFLPRFHFMKRICQYTFFFQVFLIRNILSGTMLFNSLHGQYPAQLKPEIYHEYTLQRALERFKKNQESSICFDLIKKCEVKEMQDEIIRKILEIINSLKGENDKPQEDAQAAQPLQSGQSFSVDGSARANTGQEILQSVHSSLADPTQADKIIENLNKRIKIVENLSRLMKLSNENVNKVILDLLNLIFTNAENAKLKEKVELLQEAVNRKDQSSQKLFVIYNDNVSSLNPYHAFVKHLNIRKFLFICFSLAVIALHCTQFFFPL